MRSLRILIHLDFLGLGGHMLSTVSLASAIKRRGHEVLIAGEMGSLKRKLEEKGLEYKLLPLGLEPIPTTPTLIAPNRHENAIRLSKLATEWSADLIHTFHTFNLPSARAAARSAGIPTILTVCGGKPEFSLPDGQSETIVFSKELRDAYVRDGLVDRDRIHVVANRLPIREFRHGAWDLEDELTQRLMPGSKRILMIGRLEGAKTAAALHVVNAFALLRERIPKLQLLLVGAGSGTDSVTKRAVHLGLTGAKDTLVQYGRVFDAYRLIPHADICVGVGRSIFEAMAIGRPCVIVGSEGYSGVVSPETIEEIAYFNFSGRNVGRERGVRALADAWEKILRDEGRAQSLAEFGQGYVLENLDAEVGAQKYEGIYQSVLRRWSVGEIPRDEEDSIARYARALKSQESRQKRATFYSKIWRRIIPWNPRR